MLINYHSVKIRFIVQPYSTLSRFCFVMFLKNYDTEFPSCSLPSPFDKLQQSSIQAIFNHRLTFCSLCEQKPPIPCRSCSASSEDLDPTQAWTVCRQTFPVERPSLTSWPVAGPPTQMNGPPFSVSVGLRPTSDLSPAFHNPSEFCLTHAFTIQ